MEEVRKDLYLLVLALFVVIAAFVVYEQFLSDTTGAVGRVISSPTESATTLTGLLIVFFLVWFTFRDEE